MKKLLIESDHNNSEAGTDEPVLQGIILNPDGTPATLEDARALLEEIARYGEENRQLLTKVRAINTIMRVLLNRMTR